MLPDYVSAQGVGIHGPPESGCIELRVYTRLANINMLIRKFKNNVHPSVGRLDNRRRTLCDLAHGREQASKEGSASWLAGPFVTGPLV